MAIAHFWVGKTANDNLSDRKNDCTYLYNRSAEFKIETSSGLNICSGSLYKMFEWSLELIYLYLFFIDLHVTVDKPFADLRTRNFLEIDGTDIGWSSYSKYKAIYHFFSNTKIKKTIVRNLIWI